MGSGMYMKNIKKRIIILLTMCSTLLLMSGCTNQIPKMTEEQNMLVTEYAAGLLLKYHADYEGRLVDTSVAPEEMPVVQEMVVQETLSDNTTEETSPEINSEESSEPSDVTAAPTMSLAQVLGIEGFDVTYRAFEVCDNYPGTESSPEELFFSMKAGQGNKLLVLKLDIVNVAGQEMVFDTIGMTELDCKILINGNKEQRAYVSMLENDFMAVNRNFAVGETYEAVIVTEMPEADAQAVISAELHLKNSGRETTVNVSE